MPPRARRTPARARTLSHAEHVRMSQECVQATERQVRQEIISEFAARDGMKTAFEMADSDWGT